MISVPVSVTFRTNIGNEPTIGSVRTAQIEDDGTLRLYDHEDRLVAEFPPGWFSAEQAFGQL